MATSGLYTYSINRDALIKSAFRTLGVFNDDSPPPTTDTANAAQALNLMIKQWMSEGYPLWCVDTVSVPLQEAQVIYTIGPSANVNTYRPLRVVEARLSYLTGNDVPLTQLSRQEYNTLGNKQVQGTPNSFYYDPQLLQGKLYLYLGATAELVGNVVNLTVQRPLQDMVNSTDEFDFPVESLNALKFGLASELTTEYDVPMQKAQLIISRAEKLRETMFDANQEEASTFFTPNRWQ